jgi:hypothetical protein
MGWQRWHWFQIALAFPLCEMIFGAHNQPPSSQYKRDRKGEVVAGIREYVEAGNRGLRGYRNFQKTGTKRKKGDYAGTRSA